MINCNGQTQAMIKDRAGCHYQVSYGPDERCQEMDSFKNLIKSFWLSLAQISSQRNLG